VTRAHVARAERNPIVPETTTPRTLRICGSAAAEAIPAIHCACPTCVEAWKRGGRNIRTRTAYNLGDDVRVDFGPDSYAHALAIGRGYSDLRHLLVTHSHEDHWQPHELAYRRPGFCVVPDGPPLRVYGNGEVLDSLRAAIANLEAARIEPVLLRSFETRELGEGLSVTTLRASHKEDEDALNLLIQEPVRTVLIANDTGWWSDETWSFVAGRRIDLAVLDNTYGKYDQQGGHMGAPVVQRFAEKLRDLGCLSESSVVVANHFSHNGHALHEELEEMHAPAGIRVGYDGMEL